MQGDWIILPKFDSFQPYQEGLAVVELDNKRGFIDLKRNWIIPPKFDNSYGYREGLAGVELNNKWGFIGGVIAGSLQEPDKYSIGFKIQGYKSILPIAKLKK